MPGSVRYTVFRGDSMFRGGCGLLDGSVQTMLLMGKSTFSSMCVGVFLSVCVPMCICLRICVYVYQYVYICVHKQYWFLYREM